MKQRVNEALRDVLSDTEYTSDDGQLLRGLAASHARQHHPQLLNLLAEDEIVFDAFFEKVDGHEVFKRDDFVQHIQGYEYLPSSYTSFSNRIGLQAGRRPLTLLDEVVLTFPYKDCVLGGAQTDEETERNEVFYHEVLGREEINCLLDRKAFGRAERYSEDGREPARAFDKSENLVVKGNNLVALHSLKDLYRESVKLIYIDPPFNTGQDSFQYNDRFRHSTWLTFMKNRLEVARHFLAEDGSIMIHLNDVEVDYCRVLMDELFGRENFVNRIIIDARSPFGFSTVNEGVFKASEYILWYAKDKDRVETFPVRIPRELDTAYNKFLLNPDDDPAEWEYCTLREAFEEEHGVCEQCGRYSDRDWESFVLNHADQVFRFAAIHTSGAGEPTVEAKKKSEENPGSVVVVEREGYEDQYILNGQKLTFYDSNVEEIDGELTATRPLTNIWYDIAWEGIAGEGNVTLNQGKKPEKLLRRCLQLTTRPGDRVMDFFAGTGTTGAVAHKMDRRYTVIEQLDYVESKLVQRLENVVDGDTTGVSSNVGWTGGGSFVYTELARANASIMKELRSADTEEEVEAIRERLAAPPLNAFLNFAVDESFLYDPSVSAQDGTSYRDLSLDDKKKVLMGVLDKNQLYVNLEDAEDGQFDLPDDALRFTESFYGRPEAVPT